MAAAALLFAAAQVEAGTQWDVAQNMAGDQVKTVDPLNTNKDRAPFTEAQPSYVPPPDEDGDGQKILPVQGGIWILCGTAMAYGIVCRRRQGKR